MSSMADQFLGEIFLYLKIVSLIQELEEDKEDPLKKLKANSSVVKCRVCKGDHWTTKCPFKDSLQPLKEIEDKEKAKEGEFCWYFIDVNSYFSVSVKGYQTCFSKNWDLCDSFQRSFPNFASNIKPFN